jgi:large subunit ribosomal protein L16
MLFPKKVKHRKWHTMRSNPKKVGKATRGTTVAFGMAGLKTKDPARINSRQIEAARKILSRTTGKTGKVWIRIFPDRPYTKKPPEVKMGKGKGDPEGFQVEVKPGRVLFEVDGVSPEVARIGLIKAGKKLPVKTRVVMRGE